MDFPLVAEFAEPLEDFALLEDGGGDAVELGEIEGFHAEALERGLGGGAQRGLGVAVRIEFGGAAELGGDEDFMAGLLEELADEFLATPAAVHVGGVEEIHAGLDGGGEDGEAPGFIDIAPVGTAELPTAEADF